MDAAPRTPEPSRELDDLRRRAYGPDADIQGDPDALRRLDELEANLRPDPRPAVPSAPSAAMPAEPASEPPSEPAAAPTPSEDASASTADPPSQRRPWFRRIPLWATLAAIGIIGVVVGAWVSASIRPHADVTLPPTDHVQIDLQDDWLLSVSQWITTDAKPVQHEPFHKLQVLSVTSKAGTSCVVVSWANHWSDYSCAPEGIAPVVDFVAYLGGPQPLDRELPPGTVIRFELQGDVVGVTMREPRTG